MKIGNAAARRAAQTIIGIIASLAIVLAALNPFTATTAHAATLDLQPDGTAGVDTTILQLEAGNDHGISTYLDVGNNGAGDNRRSLLKFDLSSIPTGSTINSATLYLTQSVNEGGNTRTMRVYRMTQAWNEGTLDDSACSTGATWQKFDCSSAWGAGDGAYGSGSSETSDIGSVSVAGGTGVSAISLTASKIQEMISGGTVTNRGFILKLDTESADFKRFASSDYATAGSRPELVIDYTAPTNTPTPTITPQNTAQPNSTGLLTGLLSYWAMENSSSSESATYGTPTLTSGGCNVITSGAGKVNLARFGGSTSCLGATDQDGVEINPTGDWTWAGWLWFNDTTPDNMLISKGSSPTNVEIFVETITGGGTKFCWGTAGANCITGAPMVGGAWNFVAFGKTGTTAFIKVNNGDRATATGTSGWQVTTDNLRIGASTGGIGIGGIGGGWDEWGIWRSATGSGGALTDAQLSSLWNNGNGCTYPFTSCAGQPTTATPMAGIGGNLIRNWDFNNPPIIGQGDWSVLNRVVQAPVSLADPLTVAHLPYGSCGDKYWDMSTPAGGLPAGKIFQQFQWPGGPMYLNFEAVTNSYLTYGSAKVTNVDNGNEYQIPVFTNGSNAWQSFKYFIPNRSAGNYQVSFSETGLVAPNALVVDNVNVRTGYWGNDCPPDHYHGSIPWNGQTGATATPSPAAVATLAPPAIGQNLVQNCDFENAQSSWSLNPAVAIRPTGGATGPSYASLFTLVIPAFPQFITIPGNIYTIFNWAGGQMYVSFFLRDNSSVVYNVRNLLSGFNEQIFTSSPASSPTGWTQVFSTFAVDAPGQITLEFSVPRGSSAGIDGVAASSGEYATGACAGANTPDQNSTQAAANSTSTQAAAPSSVAGTATANAQETNDADAYATYQQGFYGTATAIAVTAYTQAAAGTQTQIAARTQTEASRQTATAQGTPVPQATATATAQPSTSTPLATFPPPATVVVPPATLTAVAIDGGATQTANAVIAQTQEAAARQTAQAASAATQAAALTATAAAAQIATNQAIVNATAFARQTSTAAAATQAQATYNSGATQTALVVEGNATHIAAATQTQAARQTQTQIVRLTQNAAGTQSAAATQTALAATGDAAQIAAATAAAAATQTAMAAATTEAVATVNANATLNARATGTSQAGATQTALVATNDATHIAGATLTAVATINQIATEQAQGTATAQAQGTQTAQGTQQVEPRPEPGPEADCVRPTNPLWLADWMDYEFCRALTWFAWSPTNSQQIIALQNGLNQYEPLGAIAELKQGTDEMQAQIAQYDWAQTGLRQDDPLPLIALFFPTHVPSGILTGQINLSTVQPGSIQFVTICSLKVGDIFGDQMAKGLCAAINWMEDIGLLAWMQYLFDVVVWLAFIRYAWNLATVTLPQIL